MKNNRYRIAMLLVFISLFVSPLARALERREVLVVANERTTGSIALARYYMEKRAIPEENLVVLRVSDREDCSRENYNEAIAAPLRTHLHRKRREGKRYRCLVVMYGMPLRVSPPALTAKEEKRLEELRGDRDSLQRELKAGDRPEKEEARLQKALGELGRAIDRVRRRSELASLDSELALVMSEDYRLAGQVSNPYFAGSGDRALAPAKEDVLMVSRLDGPDDKTVRRIIDDSLSAEEAGLEGTAYFDARYRRPKGEVKDGYAFYDRSIHRSADAVGESGRMKVVLDDGADLFPPGSAPDAALYCGWYSLGRYVDAFSWRKGAVGYHIASGECTSLKRKENTAWCKMMLEKGAAATIGPVDEPYLQAFPLPEIFFKALIDGELALAEAYMASIPSLSWKMVLIGDPLYRPFRKGR